jgi:hypothetical protein
MIETLIIVRGKQIKAVYWDFTTAEYLITANILVTGKNEHVTSNRYQWRATLCPSLVKIGRWLQILLVKVKYSRLSLVIPCKYL